MEAITNVAGSHARDKETPVGKAAASRPSQWPNDTVQVKAEPEASGLTLQVSIPAVQWRVTV
eukprot:COSAG02_NODE_11656_length_1680_cov_1.228336_2_plen_62_part_00